MTDKKDVVEQTPDLRRSGLGGSDIGAVLGLNPYKTALDVWAEKCGGFYDFVDTDFTWFGREAEDLVAKFFTRRTGLKVIEAGPTVRHPTRDYLMAHPDRLIAGLARQGLEIKTRDYRTAEQWGEQGTDEIPEHYLAQVHWYALLCDWEQCHVACLDGRNLSTYLVQRSTEWDEVLLDTAVEFWEDYVRPQKMPPLEYSHRTLKSLQRIYPKPVADSVMDGARLAHLAQTWADLGDRIKAAQDARDEVAAMLLEQIADREWCVLPDGQSLHRIHVAEAVVPSYTRKPYTMLKAQKTPKAIAATMPLTITQEKSE